MFPDYMTMAQDGGKVVCLTHRPPLPQEMLSRPQGHSAIGRIMSMEVPMTPCGIERATFRFVAQYLNHCATAVPTINQAMAIKVGENINTRDENTEHSVVSDGA